MSSHSSRTSSLVPALLSKNPIALGLLSGVVLSAAMRLPGFWSVSFIALVPVLYAIFHAKRMSEVFWAGSLMGFCVMGTATIWLFDALPLPVEFGVTSSGLAFGLVGISWLLATLVTGIVVGLWAFIVYLLKPLLINPVQLISVAVLWVLAEYGRMLTYNLLTFDLTVHNPLFFSAGFIAYPLMDSDSWRQFAAFGASHSSVFLLLR